MCHPLLINVFCGICLLFLIVDVSGISYRLYCVILVSMVMSVSWECTQTSSRPSCTWCWGSRCVILVTCGICDVYVDDDFQLPLVRVMCCVCLDVCCCIWPNLTVFLSDFITQWLLMHLLGPTVHTHFIGVRV